MMPLRDHFHPPLDPVRRWEGFHASWLNSIIRQLNRKLPIRYFAEPEVRLGSRITVDVGTLQGEERSFERGEEGGGIATAVDVIAEPTLSVQTDLFDPDLFEIQVFDQTAGRKLVAAIEIVSPANKDREEHCLAFIAKCLTLLQQKVSVTIIDVVTSRGTNLFFELLETIGHPIMGREPPRLYAVACRAIEQRESRRLDAWEHPLGIGQPLPTLPIWLSDELAIQLELATAYEETCKDLRIA